VRTFRAGLAARLAHDLVLVVRRFSVELSELEVTATFEADSLRVAGAWRDGRELPGALSAADRQEIEARVCGPDVLDAARWPQIRFRGTARAEGAGWRLAGSLALHGQERPIELSVTGTAEGGQIARATLDQRDFGIRPYSALMGALRVKPEVQVEVELPLIR
jgi:polyisoprenoid-binding protein YceI